MHKLYIFRAKMIHVSFCPFCGSQGTPGGAIPLGCIISLGYGLARNARPY